jgi:hypothetical protein
MYLRRYYTLPSLIEGRRQSAGQIWHPHFAPSSSPKAPTLLTQLVSLPEPYPFLELTFEVDGGAPPVSLSPASSTTLSGEQPNMYLRLTHDAPRLTGELQATVNMILRGTNSMRPSHIDMIGLPDTGIRWWKVAPDFVKRLYFECFALCTLSQEYRAMAPVEVQKMVAALEVSSRIIQDRVAEVSLANAIAEDQAGQYSKFNSSTAFPIDVVTSIMRHRELLPINLFQLYPRNYSAFNSRPNTTTDTQIRHVRAGSPEAPEMVGVDDTGMTSEDEQSIRSNSSADNASSFNDTGSENSNSLLSARRLERSRVSATSASSHKESNSDADEPVCPSKRLSRLKVLAQIEVSHEEEDSDYEPIRPSKRFQPSRVPIRSARSPDDVQSKDEPIRLLKRFVRPKVPARSTTSSKDVQSDDEHIRPTRRLKRSGALAKPHENEERDDDEPVRPAKRPKRSKAPVKSAKSHKDVESDDDEPSDTEKLAPGKKFVCWSNGSLRASRAIRGINDRDLPTTALNGPVHELESTCTHPNVDVRLYDFELSVEEILTVSSSPPLLFIDRISELTTYCSTFLFTLAGGKSAGGLRTPGLRYMS